MLPLEHHVKLLICLFGNIHCVASCIKQHLRKNAGDCMKILSYENSENLNNACNYWGSGFSCFRVS